MEWSNAPVDDYCERLGPGLFAEPLNALSNLAFLFAGLWLWRRSRQRGEPAAVLALPGLMVAIALGSSAFHTFATRWAEILDVAFIALYIDLFVACYLRYRWQAGWHWALIAVAVFHLAGAWLTRLFPAGAFNGSVPYLPALVGLVLFGALSTVRDGWPRARIFLWAAMLFTASLALRSLDLTLCPHWPLGTHWAWHLLNALVLSLCTLAIGRSPGLPTSRV
jgi:hypothetical protein